MDKPITKLEERVVFGKYDGGTRDEVVAAIDKALAAVPEEVRGTAYFEVGVEYDYGEAVHPRLYVRWSRPETPQEAAQRVAALETWERSQRQQYELLKKKFGDG